MRYPVLFLIASLAAAQDRPNCTGMALDFDARCGCVKDPNSQLCSLVKAGAYEPIDWSKAKPLAINPASLYKLPTPTAIPSQPATRSAAPRNGVAAIQRPAARVVPLPHTDYLRFLHHDAQIAAGINLGKVSQAPDIARALFGSGDGTQESVNAALREVDHMWMSFVAPGDLVVLMTGRFEGGAAAGMFYGRGVYPVFLGDAHVMMIGSEASMQAALGRMTQPVASASQNDGWVARRAKELDKDHEVWVVNQPAQTAFDATSALKNIRQFSLGVRLSANPGIEGEAIADSDTSAEAIAQWMDRMKAAAKSLDAVTLERAGASLKFMAKDNTPDSTKAAMSSEFGMELYTVMMAGFPGMPLRTIAQEKLSAVKNGMKKDEVLALLGKPLTVTSIQGLDTPRETWTYQVPFGKQVTLRLDDGTVSSTPR